MITAAKNGHPGGSLSAVEIVVELYFNHMRIDPANPKWADRDRFILSKGHAAPVLYSVMSERGYADAPKDKLNTLRQFGSVFQGHPDMRFIPSLEASTGSLGQGLSLGLGMALGSVNQSNVEIVGLGTDRRNPDVPALAVMNEILGGGFTSRLFQKVRTELGLAYEVGGGLSFAYDHPAVFRVVVLTKSATTVDATRAALGEIDGLTSKPFTQDELDRAKDNLLNSFLFRYDTRDKVLAERVRLEFYAYPADYLETYRAALEKVTLADLNAVARKYIHPGKLAVLVVGNGPEIKPGLDELKLGPVQAIDIAIPQPGPQSGKQPGENGAAEKKQ